VIVRAARPGDGAGVLALAQAFATSFVVDPSAFARSFPMLLGQPGTRLLVADEGANEGRVSGYLLGFVHPTFYANGPVGWVEELMVDPGQRRRGLGRLLMKEFEAWVASQGGGVVALATRRAAEFYQAIGYEESATYFRKEISRERF
jgi:GNAT superfamily N-acetyltransferase